MLENVPPHVQVHHPVDASAKANRKKAALNGCVLYFVAVAAVNVVCAQNPSGVSVFAYRLLSLGAPIERQTNR